MTWFLDTNTCVYFLKGVHPEIRDVLLAKPPAQLGIPSLVAAELLFGAARSAHPRRNEERVRAFLAPFEVASFDAAAAAHYAHIRAVTEQAGTLVGPNDLVIAATVLARCGILVTHNLREFRRIPNLRVESWVASAGRE